MRGYFVRSPPGKDLLNFLTQIEFSAPPGRFRKVCSIFPQAFSICKALKKKIENILINEPDNKEALFSLAALFYNLGNLYLKEKKINIAIKNYLKSIKTDKEFVHSYYNLGIAYKEKEDLNNAIKFFKITLAI